MKVIAYAPGHISGFFEPFYDSRNISKTGSRGAGINVSLGAVSEVSFEDSKDQVIEVYINNRKSDCSVVEIAIKNLLGKKTAHIIAKIYLDLPFSQGFGMSAASAVSSTYALSKIMNLSHIEALKASHFAEVQLNTGLGDVLACSFGGIEIRKQPGIPPWGFIEHIPGKYKLVLCVAGEEIDTKKILTDPKKLKKINKWGKYCTDKLLNSPNVKNFFLLSQVFTQNTKLASKHVMDVIDAANEFGMASMCMLGNSVFAIGETDKIYKKLKFFKNVYVCDIDEYGARIVKGNK